MRTIISVVSHRHHDVIINLESLRALAALPHVEVICRDNQPVSKLRIYCEKYGMHYVPNDDENGFAANNNANVRYYQAHLDPQETDFLLILNPDVVLSPEVLALMEQRLKARPSEIIAPNLYLDKECLLQDDNIRTYPRFQDFVLTYVFNRRRTMIDRAVTVPDQLDIWASGACMLMLMDTFLTLEGFDERYYMYCEDIDFCARAIRNGFTISYLPKAIAVHFRRRDSKRFLTKYFFWHVASVFKYTFKEPRLRPKYSRLLDSSV